MLQLLVVTSPRGRGNKYAILARIPRSLTLLASWNKPELKLPGLGAHSL